MEAGNWSVCVCVCVIINIATVLHRRLLGKKELTKKGLCRDSLVSTHGSARRREGKRETQTFGLHRASPEDSRT